MQPGHEPGDPAPDQAAQGDAPHSRPEPPGNRPADRHEPQLPQQALFRGERPAPGARDPDLRGGKPRTGGVLPPRLSAPTRRQLARLSAAPGAPTDGLASACCPTPAGDGRGGAADGGDAAGDAGKDPGTAPRVGVTSPR